MEVVYIEAVLMDNGELLHYGRSLGFIGKRQQELVDNQATKITKGKEKIVAIKSSDEPDRTA